jgi:glycosyltransferase involved in cell wall biosynthesis
MHKIVIDARMINNSGIGTYLQNMISNLTKNYELTLLGNKNELANFPSFKELEIIDFHNPIYSISEQFTAPEKISACDIFISPHYNIPIFPIKAKKRIVIIHDVYHLAFQEELSVAQKIYSKIMMKFAVRLSDRIITVSQFSKSEILKYLNIKESKINVVYFGFNATEFSKNTAEFEIIKEKYKLTSPYFLFVGNIKPHKNLHNLLLAFNKIIQTNSLVPEVQNKLKLVVVGESKKLITSDQKFFELLKKKPTLSEKIIFTGFIEKEHLVSLYKNASALVFPSLYEGFGIPPLEAMACGCPVIASNTASIKEVCADSALYIDPQNENDIADKMTYIISEVKARDQLIEKGKANIKRFSIEKFSNNLNNVLNALA